MLGGSKVKLGIPQPCQESWDAMGQGAGPRFCEKCQHEVIDFTVLTRREAERIFKAAKGRVCGRLAHDERGGAVYRPDAGHGNLARVAGLSLVAISGIAAQTDCEVRVNVKDPRGVAISRARVDIKGDVGETDDAGSYATKVPAGRYRVEVEVPGFSRFAAPNVEVGCRGTETTVVDAMLQVGSMGGVVDLSARKKSKKR